MNNAELATELRKLADLYDSDPLLLQPHEVTLSTLLIFCHTKEDFYHAVHAYQQAFKGKGEKSADASALIFKPNTLLPIKIEGFRSGICVRRVVGEKVIPARIVPEQVIPERVEEVVEWDCPKMWREEVDAQSQ